MDSSEVSLPTYFYQSDFNNIFFGRLIQAIFWLPGYLEQSNERQKGDSLLDDFDGELPSVEMIEKEEEELQELKELDGLTTNETKKEI